MPTYAVGISKDIIKNDLILLEEEFCAQVTSKLWNVSISHTECVSVIQGQNEYLREKKNAAVWKKGTEEFEREFAFHF